MQSRLLGAFIVLLAVVCSGDGQEPQQLPGRTQVATVASPIEETARLIDVSEELRELRELERQARADGSKQQWTALALHQQILERVTEVQLEADATTASIDNETARAAEVRGFLTDKRDRKVTRANLLSALLGGGLGAVSAGLQLSAKQTNATVATGMGGGATSAALAVYGIRVQSGGTRTLENESNMLAKFFGRPEMETSHYPAVVWDFLSAIAPTDPDHLTRRERLMRTWLELKRLDEPSTAAGAQKIAQITSSPEEHRKLTIDDLEDRMAMLQDVRAKLSFLKRDLAMLLGSLPKMISAKPSSRVQ